jgi:hypothetical protein
MLVMADDDSYTTVSRFLKPLGFELIRYRHVLKAMDNIDEIDPAGVIISAKDFPRHWKTMVQFIRTERPMENCPVILLKGAGFEEEDASKAVHIGVNALVNETLSDPGETEKIQSILALFVSVSDKRKSRRYRGGGVNRFGFVFNTPADEKLVTGKVITLSASGISFVPEGNLRPVSAGGPTLSNTQSGAQIALKVNDQVPDCSLRAGDHILAPACIVRSTGDAISMEFISFPENEKAVLEAYLEEESARELKAAVAK